MDAKQYLEEHLKLLEQIDQASYLEARHCRSAAVHVLAGKDNPAELESAKNVYRVAAGLVPLRSLVK